MKVVLYRWLVSVRRNWRTSLIGLIGFLAYLGSHQTLIEPLLPEKYRAAASDVFAFCVLLGGYFSSDKHRNAPAEVADQEDPAHE